MTVLDQAYRELTRQEGACRSRIDIQIPAQERQDLSVGHEGGQFDVGLLRDPEEVGHALGAGISRCHHPGKNIASSRADSAVSLLKSIQNGAPLALIHNGDLQDTRVSADSGIVRIARE